MIKKLLLLYISVFIFLYKGNTQDIPLIKKIRDASSEKIKFITDTSKIDSSNWVWKNGGYSNFSLNQTSISNWAAGGNDFSLSFNAYINYFLFYRNKKVNWDNNLDFNLGYLQSSNLGSKKNDDRIEILSKYGYKIDTTGKWFLTGLFTFRSQLFDGYLNNSSINKFSSSFLSPAYTIFSIGMDNKINKYLSIFYSPLTSRLTFVANNYLANLGQYGVDPNTKIKSQLGAYITIYLNTKIIENINYTGRLDMFSDYINRPENIDFYMNNYFTLKVNKKIQANLSIDMIYDDDIKVFGINNNAPGLQFKSSIGIAYSLTFKNHYQ